MLIRRVAACALLASWLLSCRTYQPVPTTTFDKGRAREYGTLLVYTRDGHQVELAHAFIRPDSVVGFTTDKDPRRVAFTHVQIIRVESYALTKGATAQRIMEPPPRPADAETTRFVACVFTLFILCPPPQSRAQVPSPAPEPTPSPAAPPPPAPTAIDSHPR